MKDLYIERNRFKNNVAKLNPPVFECDLIQQTKQKFWLHQMEVSENADTNTGIRSLITTVIVLIIIVVLWSYSNELQSFLNR